MKLTYFLLLIGLAGLGFSCVGPETNNLSGIAPGRYDSTWWNRQPLRMIQTNLREIDAQMDKDAYVQSIVDMSANYSTD